MLLAALVQFDGDLLEAVADHVDTGGLQILYRLFGNVGPEGTIGGSGAEDGLIGGDLDGLIPQP